MGRNPPPREAELYKRRDEVLHYIWDPIGVSHAPGARDEYHAYLPGLFRLVRDNVDTEKIAAYLVTIERDLMGISRGAKRAREVAVVLIDWREWLWEHVA